MQVFAKFRGFHRLNKYREPTRPSPS